MPILGQHMRKLLKYLDNNILKWSVIFTTLFIILYHKVSSIHITHTWVYIRLEDFAISFVIILWLLQLIRRKVRFAYPVGMPIVLYWIIGFISLVFSLVYIAPHLANFFPSVAILEYLRRIEYMILFFVGFSVVKSKKDLKEIILFLFLGTTIIVLYGFGQHFYPYFWKYLPTFIQKTSYCFPSFQTGNEEFAKGIPLCLPVGSRVTSTFGGHYDLAGYLIMLLPVILGVFFLAKKKISKISLCLLFLTGLITLILTSSRIAVGAYLFAVVSALSLLGKKKVIITVVIISIICLGLFSEGTIRRFAQTFRLTTVVLNAQGQVIGTTEGTLSSAVQKQLASGKAIQANIPSQNLPTGSSFITLPQEAVATTTAVIQRSLSIKDAKRLQLANGGLALSTVKGNFSVQKALVYDISVTTRLQAEWPNALGAFFRNPLLGSGYSSLSLAVDNDYLRLLGESGVIGFFGFLSVFVVVGIFLTQALVFVEDPLTKIFVYGLVGGIIGLFVNATFFDIFEASKVAETLWLLLGIGLGATTLYLKKPVKYGKAFLSILTNSVSLSVYLFVGTYALFWSNISRFFIGDDFVWLKWAVTSSFSDVPKYFTQASGFFYRPLPKMLMLLFYSVFSFQPQGYHVVSLILHSCMGVGIYILSKIIFKNRLWAFFIAVIFLFLPVHGENIFWISSLSIQLSSVFILFGLIAYLKSQMQSSWKSKIAFLWSIIFSILALLSYELAIVIPLLFCIANIFVFGKVTLKVLLRLIPFVVLDITYVILRVVTHALNSGGDYSYSIPHLLPNVFGNLLGYLGLFVFGEGWLPLYTNLRIMLKVHVALVVIVLLCAILISIFVIWKKKIWKTWKLKNNILFFSCSFMGISLLPYLGLGNIAERYGYLASVGFVMLACVIAQKILLTITHLSKVWKCIIIGSVLILVGVWYGKENIRSLREWATASKITYEALGYFKIEKDGSQEGNTFYIVNLPIRRGNAWIFPTGFPQALWFLYRDTSPNVIIVDTVERARKHIGSNMNSSIFVFDSTYQISSVK